MRTKTRNTYQYPDTKNDGFIFKISIFIAIGVIWGAIGVIFSYLVPYFIVMFVLGPIILYVGIKIYQKIVVDFQSDIKLREVTNTDLMENCIYDNNFINHHNYYKNNALEVRYRTYKLIQLFKYIVGNILFILGGIFIFIYFSEAIFQILLSTLVFIILLTIGITPLIIRDRIRDGKRIQKQNTKKLGTQIYFTKIYPSSFQKIKNKIFFY